MNSDDMMAMVVRSATTAVARNKLRLTVSPESTKSNTLNPSMSNHHDATHDQNMLFLHLSLLRFGTGPSI